MRFIPKLLRRTGDVSRGETGWPEFLRNALGVAVALAGLYVALGFAADLTALHIPERLEARLPTAKLFGKTSDSPEFQRAQKVLKRLTAQPGLRPLPYKLVLCGTKAPAAYSIPGGGIAVSEDLLKEVKSETGLALVIGHELGHHQHRHALRKLGRKLLYHLTLSVLFGDSGSNVVEGPLSAAEARHSQNWERDADAFGLRMVHQAYGTTEDSLEFFYMLLRKYQSGDPAWSDFLSTHPCTPDRIERLERLRKELDSV